MSAAKDRDFSRARVAMEVTVTDGETVVVSEHTRDVSMNGVFVVGESPFVEDTLCDITIHLGGRQTDERIDVKGRVARVADDGFGIVFDEIPLDAYDHLRKLVLYDVPDADSVDDEIRSHEGIKRAEDDDES